MPNVNHNTLTTTDLHEPKGASGASANQTYVSDGAGSGSWTEPEPKGALTANANEIYVADGAGSGDWTPRYQYAEIYTQESDAVSIGSIGTTPVVVPFANNGPDETAVADSANNRITLTNAGTYYVVFTCSFSTAAAGDAGLYEFKLLDDGVAVHLAGSRQMSGSSDTGGVGFSGIITVGAGSQLTVQVESDEGGNSDDINIYHMNLSALRIGS